MTTNCTIPPVVTYPPKGISMALGEYGGHDNKAFTGSSDKICNPTTSSNS